ncbi:MAG: AAA family ATPase [Planctomycetaceae bacterium]|nr:AAA family ATPase [Planctomycetaceae bacterium]
MFVRRIELTNFLSFGSSPVCLSLEPLNVLVGPNGSGKSNLIEAFRLLQAAPGDLSEPVRLGGGVQDWIWKGDPQGSATIDAVVENPKGRMPLRHVLQFRESGHRFEVADERIENEHAYVNKPGPYFHYRFQNGHPVLNVREEPRTLRREDVDPQLSIVAQRKDPDQYPEITYLGAAYKQIRVYRDWTFGRTAPARGAQQADLDNQHVSEDFLNLGMVLNRMRMVYPLKQRLLEMLCELYAGITDFDLSINAGKVQVVLHEGRFAVPASRLSDGTLRWLCLLAILLDTTPPPLVCIEEPELGLHPDLLPTLARLLREASERTQLVVTTHSEVLVDALTETPEYVVVCEKPDETTRFSRLSREGLADWLEKYTLGQLWSKGEIGGNRW